ncbi:galactoside ABC transporter permease MglC [Candidatus Epulonipiscium fishelsonii]|uniref:Galactoside ABC transporter permease MglC n=1 Tax=Candidatus Epulonipiscium fishelsonii TaxID=77094 RepID=A0ACC8XCL5_9FIRM|nr:galactoside ABC transporter permease MglC [Epulopiscium sp. SCG-B11WGA-EpuloA1]ONI42727.1 galactoside ABC transporter permease MglC [Epulopiscium sp. SCG-B05WGA-EpuloA1]
MEKKNSIGQFMFNNAIYFVLVAIIGFIIFMDDSFVSPRNLQFILTQASTRLILAIGVAGLLILAGTDLSVGRMVGLSAVVTASLLQASDYARRIYPELPSGPLMIVVTLIIVVIIVGMLSAVNGVIIAKFNVTPFIATLGMQLVIYGINSLYFDAVGGSPIAGLDPMYTKFAQGSIALTEEFQLSYLVIYATIVTFVMWVIWNKTKLGKNMFAVGGNREAAEVSGVNVGKTIIMISIIAGMLYGFAGFLELARTGSATNNFGNGYELDAIAACVVGGVSFNGGVGSIGGIITGVLIFQVINYGFAYINISPYIQYIIKGLIIIIAVAIDTQKYVKKK